MKRLAEAGGAPRNDQEPFADAGEVIDEGRGLCVHRDHRVVVARDFDFVVRIVGPDQRTILTGGRHARATDADVDAWARLLPLEREPLRDVLGLRLGATPLSDASRCQER